MSPAQQREIDEFCMAELKRLGCDLPYEEFCDVSPGVAINAANFAKDTAINKLFATPWKADVHYTESPCTPVGGQYNCTWTYEGGSMQMTVENWPGGGYVVDSVIFVAD